MFTLEIVGSWLWRISSSMFSESRSFNNSLIILIIFFELWPGSILQSKVVSHSEGITFSFIPPLIIVGVTVIFNLGFISVIRSGYLSDISFRTWSLFWGSARISLNGFNSFASFFVNFFRNRFRESCKKFWGL